MKKIFLFLYLGGGGGPGGTLRETQGYQIFRAVRPHHRADQCITRKKYNRQFFKYGPQCEEICIFCYFIHIWGVLGGPYIKPRVTKFSGQ